MILKIIEKKLTKKIFQKENFDISSEEKFRKKVKEENFYWVNQVSEAQYR